MKKKGKLFLSLCTLLFSLGVMCFGVYSAVQVQFNVNGSINYIAPDIWAEFNTEIYSSAGLGSTEAIDSRAQELKQNGIGNIDLPLAKDENGRAYSYTYRTSEGTPNSTFNNISLDFSNCGVYFVVINIKPTEIEQGSLIVATITNDTSGTNIYTSQTDGVLTFTQAKIGQNIVIAIALNDSSIQASATINCNVSLETITDPKLATTFSDGAYTITGIGTLTDTELTIDTLSYDDGVNGSAPIIAVADNAFENNTNITSVTFSGTQSGQAFNIGASAFKNCTALQSVVIPENIVNIGASAFEGCTSLASLTFDGAGPEYPSKSNLKSIQSRAFYGCTSLTDIVFPINDGMTIYPNAFAGAGLTSAGNIGGGTRTICWTVNGESFAIMPLSSSISNVTTLTIAKRLTGVEGNYINYSWSSTVVSADNIGSTN